MASSRSHRRTGNQTPSRDSTPGQNGTAIQRVRFSRRRVELWPCGPRATLSTPMAQSPASDVRLIRAGQKPPDKARAATLIVGFDSAWTARKSGALVGAVILGDGRFADLGAPETANFGQATQIIRNWAVEYSAQRTLVLLDQPTIVANASGGRPVERIVSSAVSRRRGGMQPANTGRADMFGPDAPVWPFLAEFGGPGDPLAPLATKRVLETYPVLALIAMGWTLPDQRPTGRLPKYNPDRRKTYSSADWTHVCERGSAAFQDKGLPCLGQWMKQMAAAQPRKRDQDAVDACLCLLVGLHLASGREGLMVGDRQSGYIVVPYDRMLHEELDSRCCDVLGDGPRPVRPFRLTYSQ